MRQVQANLKGGFCGHRGHYGAKRYPASKKLEIVRMVERSHLPVKQTLAKNGVSGRAPVIVLAASKGRQFSEELPATGYRLPATGGGVFTQSLAQLLTSGRTEADIDKSGTLEISEVYRALKQAVTIVTKRRQTPWLVRKNTIGDAPMF